MLRHCATSRKVAGSIPDGVTGIFLRHNPSGRTMAPRSTQPLTEMSTRNISWGGKGGRCVGLTTLLPSCADCLEIGQPQPPGTLRAWSRPVTGLLYLTIPHVRLLSKRSLALGFPHQILVRTSPLLHTCHMPRPSQSSWFDPLSKFSEEYKSQSSSLWNFLQSLVTFYLSHPNIFCSYKKKFRPIPGIVASRELRFQWLTDHIVLLKLFTKDNAVWSICWENYVHVSSTECTKKLQHTYL
jgi:hypothetical protein